MSDPCSTPGLMPISQAREEIFQLCQAYVGQFPPSTETVPIADADNRVLAQPVSSQINVPAYDNSAMDGYGLHLVDDGQVEFDVIGQSLAGHPFDADVPASQAVKIMTGAMIPNGVNAVVMKEIVDASGDKISLQKTAQVGSNIRRAGEDIAEGQHVFEVGHLLHAADLGLLASLGIAEVTVYKKTKVAIFATGDELILPGQPLSKGQIYESNRTVLIAMLKRLNAEVIDFGIIEDDPNRIADTFKQADKQAQLVISCGGVSVGDADYTKPVLDEIGSVQFWKIAMKPGKPLAFGRLSQSIFLGLPGNPVSSTVTFDQIAKQILAQLSGQPQKAKIKFTATLSTDIRKRPGRFDFQRGVASIDENGHWQVQALKKQGSGILSSISDANCYILLEAEQGSMSKGESVEIELFGKSLI